MSKAELLGLDSNRASKDNKIRILYLVPALDVGGAEIQLYALLKGLKTKEFHVTLVAFYDYGGLKAKFAAQSHIRLHLLHKKFGLDFAYLFRLRALLRQESFDIVQAYNVSARLIGLLAARMYHIPVTIMTERNSRAVYSSLGSRIYHGLEKYAMRSANIVVANSDAGRLFCTRRGINPKCIRVIANGLDLARLAVRQPAQAIRLEWGIPEQAPVIGMVARMFPQKDHRTFLRAAERVLSQSAQAFFVLLGGGPIMAEVQSWAHDLDLRDRVNLTGQQENVADYIRIMDVVVLTSMQSEGCANALLEAMALDKPVVATDVPGNRELIRDGVTGLLVPPQQPALLADAVLRLLDQPEYGRRLAQAGNRWCLQHFNENVMVQSYAELYKEFTTQTKR